MFNRFDVVQLLTVKNIRYLSGPKNHAANPIGNWSIVGFVGVEAILAKDSTLVKVPITDIKKIANYDINNLISQINQAGYFKH